MWFVQALKVGVVGIILCVVWRLIFLWWISPRTVYLKLKRNGFVGPEPNFPLGNIKEIKEISLRASSSSPFSSSFFNHDIHSTAFPHFAQWNKSYGKVFVYWLGTEPFLYVADPEFLKKMSIAVPGAKNWGKPDVFKHDRDPMFGGGLVMTESDEWVRHRHVVSPAFSPPNLKAMTSLMVESVNKMLDQWSNLINNGNPEIDVEKHVIEAAGEIIAKISFGIGDETGRKVFEKLRDLQVVLFKTTRYVGVPYGKFLCPKQSLEAMKLGWEVDSYFHSLVASRKKSKSNGGHPQKDLLGLMLEENQVDGRQGVTLTTKELTDECKTFFFGGHETTALAISWTLFLLAAHPEWQEQLRQEIKEIIGEKEIGFNLLRGLKKMGWVMSEVLRLYPTAPNAQRQIRGDLRIDDNLTIPDGTNVWIDLVGMHHDPEIWGKDVHKFKPERFKDDLYGGCTHKMGYMPFGFGGRMCVGRNLSATEYRVVLTSILSKFSFSLSPSYSHSPCTLLSLRPRHGIPLRVHFL